MPTRLLDRPVRLLDLLSSPAAVFGVTRDVPVSQELQGIDYKLLCLEARFAHDKRMAKIATVLPNTLELVEASLGSIVLAFVDACPAADISRLENARQFYGFLRARSQKDQLSPPYLIDVAACEIAFAQVRVHGNRQDADCSTDVPVTAVRRNSSAVLVRCNYDIRPIFEGSSDGAAVVNRDTPLGVAMPIGAEEPQVFELFPAVFDLLSTLDQWTDADVIASPSERDELICDLLTCGLLEVRH